MCDESGDACVECFTVADCPDDGIACTVDQCVAGSCAHDPNDPFCDDGLFCNGQEFCNTLLGCLAVGNPCDSPALCDEINDLIWGNPHDYGVFVWLGQGADAEGKLTFQQVALDESFSQAHAIHLADLDGDGQDELITGKL